MVKERYFIAIKLKNVQTTNKVARMDKSKNVLNGKVLYSDNNRLDTNNILKFY